MQQAKKFFTQTNLNLILIGAIAALTIKTQLLPSDSSTVRELQRLPSLVASTIALGSGSSAFMASVSQRRN